MAEWSKAAVSKTVGGDEPSVGSNPTTSAIWSSTQAGRRGFPAKKVGRVKTVREFESLLLRHNKTRKDVFIMKRKYIKALKNAGVRYADKDGAKVQIKHLKLHQLINLYYEHGLNEN